MSEIGSKQVRHKHTDKGLCEVPGVEPSGLYLFALGVSLSRASNDSDSDYGNNHGNDNEAEDADKS
jgi:hypothetical protein